MTTKFGRNYYLQVQDTNQPFSSAISSTNIVIEPPFTIEFDVIRKLYTAANLATIRIYNLSAEHRNILRKDLIDQGLQRTVILKVGYGDALYTILTGTVTQCWSVREQNNFITEIMAMDIGYANINAQTSMQFAAQTPQKSIIAQLMDSLGDFGISSGAIGDYSDTTSRGTSYSGSTLDIIAGITGGGSFVDNGVIHALNDNEALATNPVPIINSQTGLLGTPRREDWTWVFNMILEPSLIIGQLVQIDSTSEMSGLNQQYRVSGLQHRGTISDAVCGDAITTVTVQAPISGSYNQVSQ